jgi:hypothetical protein
MTEETEATTTEAPAEAPADPHAGKRSFPVEIRLGGGSVTLYADGTTDVENPEKFTKELSRMRGGVSHDMLFAFLLVAVARINAELDDLTTDVD